MIDFLFKKKSKTVFELKGIVRKTLFSSCEVAHYKKPQTGLHFSDPPLKSNDFL